MIFVEKIEFDELDIKNKEQRLWEKLGSGGYSDVYSANYKGKTPVAVKIFRDGELLNNSSFLKEIEVLR